MIVQLDAKQLRILPVPYRLDTLEKISLAKKMACFPINAAAFEEMLKLAEKEELVMPPALRGARESTSHDLVMVTTKTVKHRQEEFVRITLALRHAEQLDRLDDVLPGIGRMVAADDLFAWLQACPEDPGSLTGRPRPRTLTEAVDHHAALRAILSAELLSMVRRRRTARFGPDFIRQWITADALHGTENRDVLAALRAADDEPKDPALRQAAMAELLFVRIPAAMNRLCRVDAPGIRRKALARLARLDLTGRQKACLNACLAPPLAATDLPAAMAKVAAVASRLPIAPEIRTIIQGYTESIGRNIGRIGKLYEEIFLTPELATLRKLHVSEPLVGRTVTYSESVVTRHTLRLRLALYPVKDYLCVAKSVVSSDCIGFRRGAAHLSEPSYFTIRIFTQAHLDAPPGWFGNIYLLDFSAGWTGAILIDRIQVPRAEEAAFVDFFGLLRGMLAELFEAVDYRVIVAPLKISNHEFIQKQWNEFGAGLAATGLLRFDLPKESGGFESVAPDKVYRVFHEKRPA